ncbi:MAG: polysaccharide biosynthesis tyrosine autokinase [Acidimicrobiia bacterium]|nr:polysaccharide biosynthesis tyrosine autokinase [Acidimicrobiia bacterium]
MMYQTASSAPEAARLEDYLRAIRRHKWVVIALTLLGVALAFLFASAQTPTYTATSVVAISPTPVGAVDARLVSPNLEREREILASNTTASAVIAELGLDTTAEALLKNLDIEFRPASDVMQVSYTSIDQQAAATAANAFAVNYVTQRESAAIAFYQTTISSSDEQAAALQAEIGTLQVAIDELQAERVDVATNQDPSDARAGQIAEIDAQLNSFRSEVSTLGTNIRNLDTTKRGAQSTLDTRSPAAEVLRNATPPASPDGVGRNLLLAGGLFLGGLLGIVAAFLLERLDTTARDSEDVALALGTTVMGAIPTLGLGHRAGPSSLIMLSTGGAARIAAAREAFRRLRSSIQFLNSSSNVSSIIVTSASPAEGKSLTAANLAIALAQNGSRCVLVSADLRRPALEKLFGMEGPRPGLSEYLAAAAELNAEKVPGIDNLWLIRSGTPPSNPGELLNSDRFEQMVKELEREDVEYVVIDTPPVLSTADAVSAARYVDGVIVVVDTERTETSDLLQVRADLERSGSKLLGAVMNRQKFDRGGLFRRDKYAYYRSDARRASG